MRLRLPLRLIVFALAASAFGLAPAVAGDDDPGNGPPPNDSGSREILKLPGLPPMPLPPGVHIFGSDGQELQVGPGQGLNAPPSYDDGSLAPHHQLPSRPPPEDAATRAAKVRASRAAALKQAMAPQPAQAALRAQTLDSLFKRLATASDADEAGGIATQIENVWMQCDSDTAKLLFDRAVAAQSAGHLPLALVLFDKIVALEPNWAEGWNKRAATRLLGGDLNGAADDFRHVLTLEPRQFSALVALGFILEKQGFDKHALEVFRKALALNPQEPEIRSLVEKLKIDIEGRDI